MIRQVHIAELRRIDADDRPDPHGPYLFLSLKAKRTSRFKFSLEAAAVMADEIKKLVAS